MTCCRRHTRRVAPVEHLTDLAQTHVGDDTLLDLQSANKKICTEAEPHLFFRNERRIFRITSSRLSAVIACIFFCVASTPSQAAYRVEIITSQPLKDLLSEHLDLARYQDREDLVEDQLNFMLATAPDQVARLAATEGYFSTKTAVSRQQESGATFIRLTVDAGTRTSISTVDIAVAGVAATHSPAQAEWVRRRWRLRPGEPFRQQDWAEEKQNGLQILQRRRYPAARIAESEARIYADEYEAALSVKYDSGPVFTIGEPDISGNSRYPASIVRNLNPLHLGEEYSAERLFEFQRQLLRTPYFSNAVVDIEKDPARATLAPIKVHLTEFPIQHLRGGIGYTSDTGAHLDGLYSHNDIFRRAWVLDAQARLEQERQFGAVGLSMPPGESGFIHKVHGSAERTTLEGIDLRSRRLGVRRERATDKTDTAYSIEYYRDRLARLSGARLPPDTVVQPGTHQALVAGIDKTRRQVDNLAFPRRGRIVSIQAGVALKGLLTDQTFLRLYGRLHQYLPVGRRDLVILRTELGAVVTKGGNADIPASLLFRAGGTESVRGYGFQSIGNELDGTIYPARFLATGGVEYQHWRSRKWGGAVFYDLGMAADRWQGKSLFHAVGFGVRWRTPVGRVSADLAYGFQANKFRPHLSLGVAF